MRVRHGPDIDRPVVSLIILSPAQPLGVALPAARHNTLWALANMACCNENMTHMAHQPGLLDVVTQAAHAVDESGTNQLAALPLQHSAFRCLLNLSCEPRNKMHLSQREDLVDAIRRTVETRHAPRSASGDVGARRLQTRLFALGTLRNLAHAPPPHKRRLCTTQVLNVLCGAARSGREPSVRDKAVAVVFNLVSSDTAQIIVAHPGLLGSLVDAASMPVNCQEASSAYNASIMACRALNALHQMTSRGPEACHASVRAAIERVSRPPRCPSITPVPD